MTPLILKMSSVATIIVPKLQALGLRASRALDDFAAARMRNAVPQWRLREAQREINRYHRLMHTGRVAAAERCKSPIGTRSGGTMRGARGSAESRSSTAARPSHPPHTHVLPTAIRRLTARTVGYLRNLHGTSLRPYRPELHYMRGPGPRWRAKHGAIVR